MTHLSAAVKTPLIQVNVDHRDSKKDSSETQQGSSASRTNYGTKIRGGNRLFPQVILRFEFILF